MAFQGAASKDSNTRRNRIASSLTAWARWVPSRMSEGLGISKSCSVVIWSHSLFLR